MGSGLFKNVSTKCVYKSYISNIPGLDKILERPRILLS